MSRVMFILKQIVPFTYVSKYRTGGEKYLAVWKQWLGKPFSVKTYELR